jgi:uncharacterized protein YqjF (DUF2071 family)
MTKELAVVNGTWQHILMVNYEVEPSVLRPLLPKGTQLSAYEGRYFVTLSGQVFSRMSVFGIRIPFHKFVPEVNLRFYVEPSQSTLGRRGTVIVREITSRRLIATAANVFFHRNYALRAVEHALEFDGHYDLVSYQVKGSTWFQLRARLRGAKPDRIAEETKKDYFLHNFLGYSGGQNSTATYCRIEHPFWQTKFVVQCDIMMDFAELFGKRFSCLNWQKPDSVYYTIGSQVSIFSPQPVSHLTDISDWNIFAHRNTNPTHY